MTALHRGAEGSLQTESDMQPSPGPPLLHFEPTLPITFGIVQPPPPQSSSPRHSPQKPPRTGMRKHLPEAQPQPLASVHALSFGWSGASIHWPSVVPPVPVI